MLRSMTGFGQATLETPESIIRVEIKSVNSKNLDLIIRAPKSFAEKEITLRSSLSHILQRGKIGIYIENELHQNASKRVLNRDLLLAYYNEVKEVAEAAGANTDNILPALLSQSDIIQQNFNNSEAPLVEWELVEKTIHEALNKYDEFRLAEGTALATELRAYIESISASLGRVELRKDERLKKIKTELREKIQTLTENTILDENRLEQELIYYAERLDITEEIVRLSTHLKYFLETMEEEAPGKKLGFISQEIGREINTIGSKANDAAILKDIVLMKEELEKIKEQMLNVL